MTRILSTAPVAYIVALVLSKAAGFLMLPLVASRLSVDEFARLEVMASVADVAGVICGLGLADAFFRFATTGSQTEKAARSAQLLGCAVLAAVVLLILGQVGLSLAGVSEGLAPRCLAVSVALTAAIELPLGWLRSSGQAWRYASIFLLRTLVQCGLAVTLLLEGFGLDGLFAAAAVADLVACVLLVALQARAVGFRWPGDALGMAVRYGAPLALGGIAGFALGSLDRWFLIANVPTLDLALYGVAVKFGALVAVAMQPFGLWWYPRRLSELERPGGIQRSAKAVGLGLLMLWSGAAGVAVFAPIAIRLMLPETYLGARELVPWVALCFALHETASLVNVGSYRRQSGLHPMLVNWGGAGVAVIGYAIAIPLLGVAGAILATAVAHLVRVILFLWMGRAAAPISYPWGIPALAAAVLLMIALKPIPVSFTQDLVWTLAAILALGAAAVRMAAHALSLRGDSHAS